MFTCKNTSLVVKNIYIVSLFIFIWGFSLLDRGSLSSGVANGCRSSMGLKRDVFCIFIFGRLAFACEHPVALRHMGR